MKKIILRVYFLLRYPWLLMLRLIFTARKDGTSDPRSLLVLRPDGLGDLVLTIPMLDHLRSSYPGTRIDLYVRPELAGLAKFIPAVDRVIAAGGAGDWRAIRREKYDICIDPVCTYGWYPAFLCLASGAPTRIGFAGGGTKLFFTRSVDDAMFPRIHMASLALELLRLLGIRPGGSIPRIEAPRSAGAGVRVVIHPGGRYPSQEWGDDRFRDLAVRIRDNFPVEVAFIGAPSERKRLEKIAEGCGAGAGVFCGDIAELVPFLAGSALFIGNNSGPLHLAAALSVPTVSFMGPTDPQRFMPLGDARNSVLRNAELVCSPCGKGRCLRHRCLRSISVEQAFDTVQAYLQTII